MTNPYQQCRSVPLLQTTVPADISKGDIDGNGYQLAAYAMYCHEKIQSQTMSPTIFRSGSFRFYFFSREEPRLHVHVQSPDGEAKFWLEPVIALAQHTGLSRREISEAQQLVQEHENDIRSAWQRHFGA